MSTTRSRTGLPWQELAIALARSDQRELVKSCLYAELERPNVIEPEDETAELWLSCEIAKHTGVQ